ncbi:MAG: hypothetical protein IKJ65_00420 [Clostridia bacterium]|nr:hypothetical protein [Clostridia bacterium]
MTKRNFLFLVLTAAGSLLFALGMCMCLVPEWNAFTPGVITAALGMAALLAIALVKWISHGKPIPRINWHKTGRIAYCVVSALVFGAGLAMLTAFENMMIPGMIVGIV